MSFKIVTDSSCNLKDEVIEQLGLEILTLFYIINGEEKKGYIKGQDFDYEGFYSQLQNKASAKTSQATPEQARELFKPIVEAGSDVLYIGFSSGLSGTFNAVRLALEELKEEYPDRKILYEDTLAASAGQAWLVLEACKMRDEGKSIEEVQNWIADSKMKLCHYFTVDDLWHLQRGGRLSAGKALMGSVLSVKPILIVNNEGKLVPIGKARGRKKSLDTLVEKMMENIDRAAASKVSIIHSVAYDDAEYLSQQVKERLDGFEVDIFHLEPVIGTHTGPGICALIFMAVNGRE
ncbi:MAG: DegV family protein [Defluviitaleaceae bacterium]|nr:DegV family protein [Defluviitaleaceae bacterium]